MNYRNYLQEILGDEYIVTDELNFDFDGEKVAVVIKYLSGNHYKDSLIQPVQLAIYTQNMPETKTYFDAFTKTYHTEEFGDGITYVKQFYSTPMVLSNFEQSGNNYSSQIIISGTLVISENVSDIKTVFIDSLEYETTSRDFNFIANPDNQRNQGYINSTIMQTGMIRFSCSLINKASPLGQKIRDIRTNKLNINTTFKIKLIFTDNNFVEEYDMKLESSSFNSENQSLPTLVLSFMK